MSLLQIIQRIDDALVIDQDEVIPHRVRDLLRDTREEIESAIEEIESAIVDMITLNEKISSANTVIDLIRSNRK